MGTGPGAGPDHLTHLARLIRSPETHHIFHALRVLEAAFAEAPRLGESRRPSQDRLRIGQEAELAFPTSAIAALVAPAANTPAGPAAEAEAETADDDAAAGRDAEQPQGRDGAGREAAVERREDREAPAAERPAGAAAGTAAAGAPAEAGADAPPAPPAAPPGTWRLTNRAFGLFGPHGPLPLHLTEYARDRRRNHRDPTFIAFADMLTHRLAGLFYRAYASAQPAPAFDRAGAGTRPGRPGAAHDPFAARVAAVAGVLGPGFSGRDALPDAARLHFAGLFGQGARHADGLQAIVSAFIRAPVTLQEFVGSWLELEPGDRWALGTPAGLGRGTAVGTRVWSRSARIRLRIGPLDLPAYRRLLPGQPSLKRLDAAVRAYAGDALDYDINLVLRADAVPRARLGAGPAGPGDTQLGLTSWIGSRGEFADDADPLCLQPARHRTAAAMP